MFLKSVFKTLRLSKYRCLTVQFIKRLPASTCHPRILNGGLIDGISEGREALLSYYVRVYKNFVLLPMLKPWYNQRW
jgi:hypothetical protein